MASAQHLTDRAPARLIISEKAIAAAFVAEQPVMRDRRDSVKNGAIIGAIVGGIAMGGFVGWLCNALKEPGNPSCLGGTLMWTGIGAGAGAAAGAGIDLLFSRNGPPSLRLHSTGVAMSEPGGSPRADR